MKKRLRLVRRRDFQRVLERPRLYAGRSVVAFGLPAEPGAGAAARPSLRVGVAVSRRVRGAVARNRARRRVREAVRLSTGSGLDAIRLGTAYDVVLIARPAALTAPLPMLVEELRAVWGRLPR
ncbi:MAG: ribonuclease P protein component [Candidatus Dormiibacterota bacterium]